MSILLIFLTSLVPHDGHLEGDVLIKLGIILVILNLITKTILLIILIMIIVITATC